MPSVSKRYHDATNYTVASVRSQGALDFATQPAAFKEWVQAQRVPLRGVRPEEAHPDRGPLSAARLGVVLQHTYGVTRVHQSQGMTVHFRAAPSAGALYPAELYVAVRDVDGIPDGLLAYRGQDHSLVLCWEGDFWRELSHYTFDDPAVREARLVIIGTGVYQRSAWRYRDRAYRRVLLDTGHVFGNLLEAAHAHGWGVRLLPDFVDDGVNGLLLLDPAAEGSLLVAALTDEPVTAPRASRRSARAVPEDVPQEGYWIPIVHRAGHLGADPPTAATAPESVMPAPMAPPVQLSPGSAPSGARVLETIRHRRSTRSFVPHPVSLDDVGSVLAAGYPTPEAPSGILIADALTPYVVCSGVAPIGPGVYRYEPGIHALHPLRQGDPRRALHGCCLGQVLGRDCAFAVVHVFDLEAGVARFGDRVYRSAHLEAGVVGQRLNLAALHRGLGASGIGGFFDEEVARLLDLGSEYAVAYVTTIGVPEPGADA